VGKGSTEVLDIQIRFIVEQNHGSVGKVVLKQIKLSL